MIFAFADCELDPGRVVLRRDGRDERIEPQVFELLRLLIERRNQVVLKEELLDHVWGDRFVSESALTTRMKSLRRAVGDDGTSQRVIRTVHGKGYEFVAEVRILDAVPAGQLSSMPPPALQSLIGRSTLLDLLVHEMETSRLITLVGTGGVGKTSVAFEMARRVVGNYRDGVHIVELAQVVNGDTVFEAFATALDVNTRQSTSIDDAIVDMLRSRHVLLILDNCEHLIESVAALVGRIMRAAPEVAILATSREPLSVRGEQLWNVEPLPSEPAVALFVERAHAADPTFQLSPATTPAVLEICRRLDGIPLAIELAASRARSIDVTEIAQRLDERFRLLKGVRRGVDPRHRTLLDAISWSYDLLSAEEQRLFTSLAVFAGPFDLGAAESVGRGDDVLDLLSRLSERSMLTVRRPTSGGTRYELLETLRHYGRSQLDDGQSVTLFRAHARHFASIAGSVEVDLGTSHESDAVGRADAAFADLRAAQRFAVEVEDLDIAFGVIGSIREYAMRTMRYEVFAWADAMARIDAGADHPLHPLVTGVRAYGAWVRGEFEDAVALAQAARTEEETKGVQPSGLVERVLANVVCTVGDIDVGMTEMARMVEVAEASGDQSQIAHGYYMHAVACSSIGHPDEAARSLTRCREAARSTGSPTDLASGWMAAGFATPDDDAALEAFARADRLAQSAGNRWMSAFARTETSGLLVHQGRLDEGCAGLAETVDTFYRAGEWAQQWHTMSRCFIALDRIGQVELAARVLGAIEAHTTMGRPPVMTTLRNLAFDTRDSVTKQLGADHAEELRAEGAAMPVASLVGSIRNALDYTRAR